MSNSQQPRATCTMPGCKYRPKDDKSQELHLRRAHVGTVCPLKDCGITATTEKQLRKHLKAAHIKDNAVQVTRTMYKCTWRGCNKTFTTQRGVHQCVCEHVYDTKPFLETGNRAVNAGPASGAENQTNDTLDVAQPEAQPDHNDE